MAAGMDPDSQVSDRSKYFRDSREKISGGIGPFKVDRGQAVNEKHKHYQSATHASLKMLTEMSLLRKSNVLRLSMSAMPAGSVPVKPLTAIWMSITYRPSKSEVKLLLLKYTTCRLLNAAG